MDKWTSGQVEKWTSGQVDKWRSGEVEPGRTEGRKEGIGKDSQEGQSGRKDRNVLKFINVEDEDHLGYSTRTYSLVKSLAMLLLLFIGLGLRLLLFIGLLLA